jgi:transposase
MKPYVRLFCTGAGDTWRWVMAHKKVDAAEAFKAEMHEVRAAHSDDVRRLWREERLHEQEPLEAMRRFGVSRQTLDNWRKRTGLTVSRAAYLTEQRKARLEAALADGKTVGGIMREAGTSASAVRQAAAEKGVVLRTWRKLPPDDELVERARGLTWSELALALDISKHRLQGYTYSRPQLAARVREVIRLEVGGHKRRREMPDSEIVRRYVEGESCGHLSTALGLAYETVRRILRDAGVYEGAARMRKRRP